MTTIVRVSEDPVVLDDLVAEFTRPECGAVLTFLGVVRDHADGKQVASIDYTCYAEMAEKELRRVVETVQARHGVPHVAVLHRVGHLAVGEASLGVVCASPHRRETFACGLEIIDEMKKTVPIWKKEIGPDGSHWV
ncbi:MAG: molybdenum cofactor biosynthesis protein MoaE [Planctomycetota bacterium]